MSPLPQLVQKFASGSFICLQVGQIRDLGAIITSCLSSFRFLTGGATRANIKATTGKAPKGKKAYKTQKTINVATHPTVAEDTVSRRLHSLTLSLYKISALIAV